MSLQISQKKKITKTFGKYLQTQYNKSVENEFFDILRIQTKEIKLRIVAVGSVTSIGYFFSTLLNVHYVKLYQC